MNITEINELVDKINKSDISLFELKLGDNYLKMDKSDFRQMQNIENIKVENSDYQNKREENDIKSEAVHENTLSNNLQVEDNSEDLYIVNSPMVGTFYEAPGIDSDAFVKVGDSIREGDTLCIIEAMKLMNELEAEVNGEIVSILVNNGEMVEYGEPLYKIRRK